MIRNGWRPWVGQKLQSYRHGRRTGRPAPPRRALLCLESLEDRVLLSAAPVAPPDAHTNYVVVGSGNAEPQGSVNPVGLLPGQVRHAYGIDQTFFSNGTIAGDGTGQTIAIIDAFDDPKFVSSTDPNFNNSDLHKFDQQFGLPDPTFTKVAQDGSTNYPSPNSGWITEIALDVEWAHAAAPGASILLVEANNNSFTNLFAAGDYARNYPGVVAVSMSYGGGEYSTEAADDYHYTTPSGHNGVTFLAASGDSGAPPESPASSPNVVAVGGTNLTLTSQGNYSSETGWSGSGGGLSLYEPQPAYQKGVVTQSSTARANPDVSIIGGTGVAVYDSYNNGSAAPWYAIAGTSLSTPVWAGLIAVADQGRSLVGKSSLDGPSQTLPALYQLPSSDFHDITTGNNGYAAGPGYDLVTGRGTPIVNLLVPDLVTTPSVRTWTGAGPDANWSDAQNWQGGVAPAAGDVLVFGPGASQTTTTNDFAAGTSFNSISFTGSGYTVNGNDLTLVNSLDATSATGSNTFNPNVTLASATAFNAGPTSTTLTVGGGVSDGGNTLQVGGGSGTVAFAGTISGAGGVTDFGPGTLLLSGANTYSGATTLNAGTLSLGNSSALGTGTLAVNGGTVLASGGAVSVANAVTLGNNATIAGANALTFTGAATLTGNRTLTVSNTGTTTFAGGVGQSGGNWGLTKGGNGPLVLSGAGTYGGTTTLAAGTLGVGSASALGTGTFLLTGGTVRADGGAQSVANAVTVGGNVTIAGTNDLTFSAAVTLTGNRNLSVSNTGTTTLASGVGQSGGNWVLTKAGQGVLVLPVASSYAGGTTLASGTLQLGDPAALGSGTITATGGTIRGSGTALTLANAVTLGGSLTLAGSSDLTLTGPVTLTGNRTLTVSNTGATTISGAIGQSGGNRVLTKGGNSQLVLSGTNTYAGGTILSAGTLAVAGANALGTGTLSLNSGTILASGGPISAGNAVTLGGNVTLGGVNDLSFTGAATLTGNRTLTVSNTGTTTFSGGIGQSGGTWGLIKSGTGQLVLSGAGTYGGNTTLNSGTLSLGNNAALGTAGKLLVNGGTVQASGGAVAVANAVTLSSGVTVGGANDLTFSGPVSLTGSRTLTVTNTGNTTFSGAISQTTTSKLTKAGAGVLILGGTNTYTGGTAVTAGTLLVNGSLSSTGTTTVSSGAALGGTGTAGAVSVSSGGALTPGASATRAC